MPLLINKKIAKKVVLIYSSNITSVPLYIMKLWEHFRHVHIGASVDGFGDVNNFVRYPSKWSHINDNLLKLEQSKNDNLSISIEPTISLLNVWHLPEFIEFVMKQNYKKIGSPKLGIIRPHPVHVPHYLNLNILEHPFKEQIKEHFESYKKRFRLSNWNAFHGSSKIWDWSEKITNACKVLDDYASFMYQTKYVEKELLQLRSQFIYFMDKMDKLRGTQWNKIFPELYKSTTGWRELPKYKI